jgi:hypothetical protein
MIGERVQMVLEEELEANEDVYSLSDSRLITLMDPASYAACDIKTLKALPIVYSMHMYMLWRLSALL